MDWEDYRKWLFNNKSNLNAKYTLKDSKRYHNFAFSDDLVSMKPSRKRQDILKGISNITRYLDIKNDTEFHELWLKWLKRKEIKWRMNPKTDTYLLANQIKMEDVLKNIRNLPEKYKLFAIFVLVSGLRTSEAIEAFNNHDKICRDKVIEMFWDRGTKKANAVYCHPLLHNKMNYQTSASRVTKNLHSKYLGCEVRYLRKLNYTVNATKIDPLLAEFMQGRRGNVSQRHYFLPILNQYKNKWIKIWSKIILQITDFDS
jgi:intergrase/recombinase